MSFITQGKTNWKYIVVIIIVALLVVGLISVLMKYFPKTPKPYKPPTTPPKVFSTKEECEEKTECEECTLVDCDVIPPGKTIEEVCGKDFKKGWQCIKQADETADWKIYTNEEYGFEIKYPEEWVTTLEENGNGINLEKVNCNFKIQKVTKESYDNRENTLSCFDKKIINVNGVPFEQFSCVFSQMDYRYRYYFEKDRKYYLIEFRDDKVGPANKAIEEGKETPLFIDDCWSYFDEMLSTLRFIEGVAGNVFPDDYILKTNEVPSGFQLKTISSEDAARTYLTGNPGFFDNGVYKGLFTGADPLKIEKFYASFYVKPERSTTELGIYVIKYKSEIDFNLELEKLKVELRDDSVYLRNGDILVMTWSDGGAYMKEVKEITDELKIRLNLKEI